MNAIDLLASCGVQVRRDAHGIARPVADYTPAERESYSDLVRLVGRETRADVIESAWRQIEQIKNRHGGFPPAK